MKDNYYSFLKGVAIIAVVVIHTAYSGYYPSVSSAFMRQCVTFAVGLFYFISGFFVSTKMSSFSGAMGGKKNYNPIHYMVTVMVFRNNYKGNTAS